MYSAGKREEAEGGVSVRPHGDCKVDTVCIAVRKELVKMGENTYLLSIITTYVKLTKPELEIVLSMIERVKGQNAPRNNYSITIINILFFRIRIQT